MPSRSFALGAFRRRHLVALAATLACFAGSLASAAEAPLPPAPTGDMTLSPSGPYIEGLQRARPAEDHAQLHGIGSSTYTYLRCWYRVDSEPLKPLATYEWGRDPSSGDWYRVPGYWWADGILRWKNMFYSVTTQETLNDVCAKTLEGNGIRQPVLQAVAANNQLSFNYTVWTLDSADQGDRLNRIVMLGDSLSDTQNAYNATFWHAPNRMSWNAGRFSNGQLWVEYLSSLIKLPVYNWAIGGAAADRYFVIPGVTQQVDSWKEKTTWAQNYRAQNTLFLVFIGANDLMNAGRTARQSAASVRESLIKLADAGATHILLLNLPDLTRAPAFLLRHDAEAIAAQVAIYNRQLARLVEEMRSRYGASLRLELFDTHAVFDDLFNHPQDYGFENMEDACLDIQSHSALAYLSAHAPSPACRDPGGFVFWDTVHPTTATHRVVAEKVAAFLKDRFADRLAE
ncbi:MAG TPA: SGNH/GDSL hydrolase family protein [Trinickia sp.]|uniref:SGNH/GDSL hydrolase family protein n=1 Tax=Trinickia sp. TaxID=2571163 RepID=UPI002C7C5720|nr:SGNH/GDSL hydrolase family protein [Trinickia sp.]HTI19025.1 SGNH/GDSL hydrolase family protein [Trinickia sp.]